MNKKISIRIKAIMSDILYDKFLANLEDNDFILVKYGDGLIRLEKDES